MSWRLSLVYQCYVSVIHWYFFLNLGYIQASRALMIASIVMGFLGIIATLVGMQCSKVAGENYVLKGRIAGVGGVFFLLQGNSATQWLSRAPECSELPSATDMNLASVYCVCTRSVYNDCSFVVCFQHHSRVLWSTVSRNKVSLFSLNLNLLQLYYYLWTYYWQHFQASCVWINVCTVVWVSSSSSYVMFITCAHVLCAIGTKLERVCILAGAQPPLLSVVGVVYCAPANWSLLQRKCELISHLWILDKKKQSLVWLTFFLVLPLCVCWIALVCLACFKIMYFPLSVLFVFI